ncbi:MAG: hypothetical protein ACJ788_16780 [Ktedonobacteraceae bacterium]
MRVQEGREIQIGDAVNRVIDLGTMIQREVTKLLLPRAIASYKSGGPSPLARSTLIYKGSTTARK